MNSTSNVLVLQARDRQTLGALAENGFMDTDMIHEHHFSAVSQRRFRQRLSQYQEHGLTRVLNLRLWPASNLGGLRSCIPSPRGEWTSCSHTIRRDRCESQNLSRKLARFIIDSASCGPSWCLMKRASLSASFPPSRFSMGARPRSTRE